MSVNQGLKTLIESSPNFSNQAVQNLIATVNIGWVAKTRTLAQKVDASTILINSQKSDLLATLDIQPHLNLGRILEDLDNHTAKIFTGELGEARDDNPASLFLDHVQTVQGFTITIPTLYGYSADSINKGVAGHFGSVFGSIDTALGNLKTSVEFIKSKELATDTAYQTATQNIIDFIDALGDSTAFDESTFNALQSAFQTAANDFNTALTDGQFAVTRTDMINNRVAIQDQINLEATNLGAIDTYNESLAQLGIYVGLTENQDIINLITKSSQNADFKSYFENFNAREAKTNPLYTGVNDSSEEIQINEILKLRGLPDVTDHLDLDSVAAKALKDDRIKTGIKSQGKTAEQIITDSCDILGISKNNKNIYALSKGLLENMNKHDRNTIKAELDSNQEINTLS
tara:strand:- start:1129 stop:2337 length:1209 start_codon:yes stop_codon:yes gene_type:complete